MHGDRELDLGLLAGRRWDRAIDMCGYLPRLVRLSAAALRGAADHYTFISTESVYADSFAAGTTEESPLATLADPAVEEITGETYGGLKALCEEVVRELWGDASLIVRPGLVVGPGDHTDRFSYWPVRASRGGRMLCPGDPERFHQVIDVRDLAGWILSMSQRAATGTFNAGGRPEPITFRLIVEESLDASERRAEPVWVGEAFLRARGVEEGSFPLWYVDPEGRRPDLHIVPRRAIAAGLTFRPFRETVRDTLAWRADRADDLKTDPGLDRENELLDAWYHHTSQWII